MDVSGLPVKTYSWLRTHMKYWWSANPDNHFDWTMKNLRRQYPDGVILSPDIHPDQNNDKDDLDEILHKWCMYAFDAHRDDINLDRLRNCLNDIIAVRCMAGIYDGVVSFPKWLQEFKLDKDRRLIGLNECQ